MRAHRWKPSVGFVVSLAVVAFAAVGAVWSQAAENDRIAREWDWFFSPRGSVGVDASGNTVYVDADGKVMYVLPPSD